jgi:vitamin B12 transporter
LLLLIALMTCSLFAFAVEGGSVRGVITDPLGAVVSGAAVELLQGNQRVAIATTDGQGNFQLGAPSPGHYRVRASAPGFASQETSLLYIGGGRSAQQDLALKIGPVTQELVISATGTSVPDSRTGASVSVVSADQFADRLDVLEPLRQVPGAQILQSGQRGTQASIFLRGGNSNASKVLLDGIPLNDIGGTVNLGTLATTGIQQIEVLRGPNSALFGSDAMAGVVSLTTRRGVTPLPEISYALDGGNFHTRHQDVDLAGAFRRLDYFGEFSRFDTNNSVPNNTFHNATYVANLGLALNSATELRVTGRYTTTALGQPNAIQFFGIPDDSFERDQDGYLGVTFQNQTTSRWHNLLRYTATRLRIQDVNPTPTGIPFDNGFGFGLNYLGQTVTIRGANGFSTTGPAILDFGGVYPLLTGGSTKRDSAYLQTDLSFSSRILGLLAFRYENERGFTLNFGTKTPADRNNFSVIAEVHGSLGTRAYVTLGGSVEKNAVFGVAAVPRASAAYYLVRPRSGGFFNGTKLKFNYGQGIRAPSISDEALSLFAVLSTLPGGTQSIAQLHLAPISAERSRSFDVGLEQLAWHGRAKFAATFFHNRFTNQIEFAGIPGLEALGVPLADALATGFGATLNSGDTHALGAETEIDLALGRGFTAHAAYTYLDAIVERSFTNDAFSCLPADQSLCAFNPAFPTVPIGAFTPLEGSRPFRRAPHAGSFSLAYAHGRLTTAFSGTMVSRRDDSTFLSDPFFGSTMLLPNRNLDGAYQRFDWSGNYSLSRRVSLYAVAENLASQHYAQVIGFPALPLTFRAGFKVTLGGESWK